MDLKLKKQFRGETNLDVFVWDENNNVAYTEAYVEWLEKQLNIPIVSQRSELLPAFLEKRGNEIITLKTAGTDISLDWQEYLKAVNCG
jgi:hypothetical protein